MKEFDRAEEILDRGTAALVVFTRGDDLEIGPDGTGSSGYWKVSSTRNVDRLILYLRDGPRPEVNELYRGRISSIGPRREDGRRVIYFRDMEAVGSTRRNWREFADGSTNPLRYVGKA